MDIYLKIVFFVFFLIVSCVLIEEYFFRSALKYIKIDLIELLKYKDDEKKVQELISEAVAVRIGLALRRLHNALMDAGQETAIFKNISDDILSINWREKIGEGKLRVFSLNAAIPFPVPRTDAEKKNARILTEAISELKKLQEVSGYVSSLMDLRFSFKIKLVKTAK